eukprot:CAMPEP_0184652752 /NCGR_PEP_ID=MMETSP0308-20130426/10458_1 /TAXON_ID=38269 /ORGANISM="Gloeochaete witrockiana, Strain SAG 46.84" /LENGTH=105 /DNA_ID=CAMNT_0027087817 /DNA_START=161 /DNA_END=478 /DNA_ORIENTATION=-
MNVDPVVLKVVFETNGAFQEFFNGCSKLRYSKAKALYSGRTGIWRVDVVCGDPEEANTLRKLEQSSKLLEQRIVMLDAMVGGDASMASREEHRRRWSDNDPWRDD